MTIKKVVNFFEKKVHPRQNPGYAYGLDSHERHLAAVVTFLCDSGAGYKCHHLLTYLFVCGCGV